MNLWPPKCKLIDTRSYFCSRTRGVCDTLSFSRVLFRDGPRCRGELRQVDDLLARAAREPNIPAKRAEKSVQLRRLFRGLVRGVEEVEEDIEELGTNAAEPEEDVDSQDEILEEEAVKEALVASLGRPDDID